MNKYLKNEKGITIVELLAVLFIGAIIFLLISNVHLFSQKQYKSQSERTRHLYDVTYAAKVITKEIRKADERLVGNIGPNNDHIKLTDAIEYKYNKDNQSIYNKDGTIIVKDIKRFYVNRSNDKVWVEIESLSGEKVKTEITLRKGD